jgi:L-lactate dehydrogenase complex protein LldG
MSGERKQILQQLRASLRAQGQQLRKMAEQTPGPNPTGPFVAPQPDLTAQFRAQLTALKGQAYLCPDHDAALATMRELLISHEAQQVLAWGLAVIPLAGLDQLLRELHLTLAPPQILGTADHAAALARLDPVPVGISGADAAVAESGTIIVVSGPAQGRLASLLPPVHIAVLPHERIARSLPDAFALLRQRYGDTLFRDHSNITLITGPSRTADIGGEVVLGMHGPAEVHVIIIQG